MTRSRGPDVLGIVLRLWLAAAFGLFGYEKVWGAEWVPLFDAIGLGGWFRYATGAMQLLGAIALLVPATARAGAALVGLTMAGAVAVHLFVLPTGIGGALIPGVFLGFAIAALRRPPAAGDPVVGLDFREPASSTAPRSEAPTPAQSGRIPRRASDRTAASPDPR